MLLRIDHRTSYSYGKRVVLAPQTVRLCPKTDCSQKVLSFSMKASPAETGRSLNCDLDGTVTATLWFTGKSDRLVIETSSVVETLRTNPFNFIVSEMGFLGLPAQYPEEQRDCLRPYMAVSEETASAMAELSREITREAEGQTTNFIMRLCERLHGDFRYVAREFGDPWPAAKTLAEKKGSCRDLAVLFTSVCRSVGLACRLASGYALGERTRRRNHLHAWAEVYIPGGGWRGYDPTAGVATADRHVSIATGTTPELIAPVSGNFYGDGADPKLEFEIGIMKADKESP